MERCNFLLCIFFVDKIQDCCEGRVCTCDNSQNQEREPDAALGNGAFPDGPPPDAVRRAVNEPAAADQGESVAHADDDIPDGATSENNDAVHAELADEVPREDGVEVVARRLEHPTGVEWRDCLRELLMRRTSV